MSEVKLENVRVSAHDLVGRRAAPGCDQPAFPRDSGLCAAVGGCRAVFDLGRD
jgi:hypothetical protein